MGFQREIVDTLPAGNIPAILGLDIRSGETISTLKDVVPFESIHYVSEPVVTQAVEAKHPRDLPKLVEAMRRLNIEDPNLIITINQESGETLMAGHGRPPPRDSHHDAPAAGPRDHHLRRPSPTTARPSGTPPGP